MINFILYKTGGIESDFKYELYVRLILHERNHLNEREHTK